MCFANPEATKDQAGKVLLDVLAANGWSAHEGSAVAKKDYVTAVGVKVAFIYFRAPHNAYVGFILSGDYQSEGRNVLSSSMKLIPRGLDESQIRDLAQAFAGEVESAVNETYAMKLMKRERTCT